MSILKEDVIMALQAKCRILIVDDEVLIRQGIKHYLDWEKEGFEIIGEASNGKEALDIIETTKPHILLTDIVMPIMDGEELTRIVKERFPSIEVIILSSFSEYDYVRSTFQSGAVDYILKPKLDSNELLRVLHRAKGKVPNLPNNREQETVNQDVTKMLEKLILGYDVSIDSYALKQILPYSSFYLGLAYYKDESIRSKFQARMETLTTLKHCHYLSIDKEKDLILLNIEDKAAVTLMEEIQRIVNNVESNSVTFIISSLYRDFYQTKEMYIQQLEKSLPFYFPEKHFIIAEHWLNNHSEAPVFNQEWFIQEWKKKRFEEALQYLVDYAKEISTHYCLDIPEYKAFFHNSIYTITITLANMEYDVKVLEELRNRYIMKVDTAATAKDTVICLEKFLEEIRTCLRTNEKPLVSDNMKKLIEYVEKYFAEPLTLTDLATHFHFNPSYLSSYFSSHYKENFIGFLNRVRIEESTKLLENKNLTIAEISERVGYTDHSYFCKVFKKQKGMSPSNYRRKNYIGD